MKSCFTYFLDIFIKAAEGFFKYFNRLLETLRGLGKFKKVHGETMQMWKMSSIA